MQTPPPSAPPPPAPPGYLRSEHAKEIESLEQRRDALNKEEVELDRQCDEIISFLVANINLYVAMTGVGFVGGIFVKDTDALIELLGVMFVTFFVGVGLTSYTCFTRVRRMRWKMIQIRKDRKKLRDGIIVLKDQLKSTFAADPTGEKGITKGSAKRRIDLLVQTLLHKDESDFVDFNEQNMWYLIICCAVSLLYILSSVSWSYLMHIGSGPNSGSGTNSANPLGFRYLFAA